MPVSAAGCRTEPPVSLPSPTGASPAATAAAEPPLDPPGVRLVVPRIARGEERRVLGGRAHRELVHVRLADDRPRRRRGSAASRSRRTAGGRSRGCGCRTSRAIRSAQMLSLTAIGTPASGSASPFATRASTARASRSVCIGIDGEERAEPGADLRDARRGALTRDVLRAQLACGRRRARSRRPSRESSRSRFGDDPRDPEEVALARGSVARAHRPSRGTARGSSARNTLRASPPWEMGGTAARSSFWICST